MNFGLFYKEWAKTSKVVWISIVISILSLAYAYINATYLIRSNGANILISSTISNGVGSAMPLNVTPLFLGIILAFAQFLPEMLGKKLKLTLHLPLPERVIVMSMLGYGALVLLGLSIMSEIILCVEMAQIYPTEIVKCLAGANVTNLLCGFATYFLTAWIILEPTWSQRIKNCAMAATVVALFIIETRTGAKLLMTPWYIVIVVLSGALPFYSTARFKDGAL